MDRFNIFKNRIDELKETVNAQGCEIKALKDEIKSLKIDGIRYVDGGKKLIAVVISIFTVVFAGAVALYFSAPWWVYILLFFFGISFVAEIFDTII